MSQYQHHKRIAPQGMNSVVDRPLMPANRCESIKGFLPARNGELNPCYSFYRQPKVSPDFGATVEGIAFYADTPGSAFVFRKDYWIVVRDGGQVWAHPLIYKDNPPAQFQLPYLDHPTRIGFLAGPTFGGFGTFHVRSAQYRDELFIVQDQGGTIPQRIFKDSAGTIKMVKCGIDKPSATSFTLTDTGVGPVPAGTYNYRITWADEKFRESSPSATVSITQAINREVTVHLVWPADPQVKYAYIYRAAQGTTTYYQILPSGQLVNYVTRPTITLIDDNLDAALLATAILAPLPGENDPPTRSNMVEVHKDRLWFNDRSNLDNVANVSAQDNLYISNLSSPTQFSVIGDPDRSDDGCRLLVSSQSGDEIMGLQTWGSLLMVAKRHGMYEIWGEGPSDFEVRKRFDIGCVATDTFKDYGGILGWLGINGFYALTGDTLPILLSSEIEDRFTGFEYIYPP